MRSAARPGLDLRHCGELYGARAPWLVPVPPIRTQCGRQCGRGQPSRQTGSDLDGKADRVRHRIRADRQADRTDRADRDRRADWDRHQMADREADRDIHQTAVHRLDAAAADTRQLSLVHRREQADARRGLSQSDLAGRAGVSTYLVSLVECGRRDTPFETLLRSRQGGVCAGGRPRSVRRPGGLTGCRAVASARIFDCRQATGFAKAARPTVKMAG